MEDILSSIRRIIADEPGGMHRAATPRDARGAAPAPDYSRSAPAPDRGFPPADRHAPLHEPSPRPQSTDIPIAPVAPPRPRQDWPESSFSRPDPSFAQNVPPARPAAPPHAATALPDDDVVDLPRATRPMAARPAAQADQRSRPQSAPPMASPFGYNGGNVFGDVPPSAPQRAEVKAPPAPPAPPRQPEQVAAPAPEVGTAHVYDAGDNRLFDPWDAAQATAADSDWALPPEFEAEIAAPEDEASAFGDLAITADDEVVAALAATAVETELLDAPIAGMSDSLADAPGEAIAEGTLATALDDADPSVIVLPPPPVAQSQEVAAPATPEAARADAPEAADTPPATLAPDAAPAAPATPVGEADAQVEAIAATPADAPTDTTAEAAPIDEPAEATTAAGAPAETAAAPAAPAASVPAAAVAPIAPTPVAVAVASPAVVAPAVAAPATASRPLDEALAELLKPALKEWLNENMPRILEKALSDPHLMTSPKPATKAPDENGAS